MEMRGKIEVEYKYEGEFVEILLSLASQHRSTRITPFCSTLKTSGRFLIRLNNVADDILEISLS